MCGITGFIRKVPQQADKSHYILNQMSDQLVHRGPDSAGTWASEDGKVALAHRRLAILDLSAAGHQPMVGSRFCLTFNGEIYNYKVIKAELKKLGAHFSGHSDTEALLQSLEFWGIEKTLNRLEGMFAFAAYDLRDGKLYLARDRMGEKPLYYSKQGDHFLFSSELKTFKQYPNWQATIDQKALSLYFKHNCIPAPYCIYQDSWKLNPGHYLTIDPNTLAFTEHCYWSVEKTFLQGSQNPFTGSADDAAEALDKLLRNTIHEQMVADVPLGSFLSGGIDSSTVTAIMQNISTKPINTYSIGFDFHDFNEAEHAKTIAKHLGTSHTEFYVSEKETQDVLPLLPEIYDEPFADSSQIPTYLVCKLAKQHVTVALSGDGGDELFSGYSRYAQTLNNWEKVNSTTGRIQNFALQKVAKLPTNVLDNVLSPALSAMGKYPLHAGLRLKTKAWKQQQISLTDYYRSNIEFWPDQWRLLQNPMQADYVMNNHDYENMGLSRMRLLQLLDSKMYLPDDILTKVDRAGMAVSLETRIPLLNHNIVEFSASLPDHINIRNGKDKWPLQQILSKYVPVELFDRPKQGFAIPLGEWLRGPLNAWMEDLLSEESLAKSGFFKHQSITPIIKMHMDGDSDFSPTLWSLLMFQSWFSTQ